MKTAPRGGTGGGPPFGQGWFFLALTGGGDFSHDDGWFIAPPMSSEETPPLHFRLKPKIPLKLRSFISGLRAALRAVGLRNAPAGAVLSPPDPLRWAPAGAPPFLSAEKEKTLQRALSPLRGSPWRAVHGPLHSPWRLCRLGLRRPPCGEKRKRLFGPCGSALHSSELLRKLDAWMQGHSSLPALRAWPMPWGMIRPPRPPALSVDCLRGPVP